MKEKTLHGEETPDALLSFPAKYVDAAALPAVRSLNSAAAPD